IVTAHHSLEDASVFPHLRRIEGAGPVIDRLTAEHRVIHDLLEALDRALVELVATPDGGVDRLRAVIDRFGGALRSHLVYEERELMHPLAQAGFY
ncbi:MAG: hemerythrin domain-containing protein, partial [Lapillicoccus sp.]